MTSSCAVLISHWNVHSHPIWRGVNIIIESHCSPASHSNLINNYLASTISCPANTYCDYIVAITLNQCTHLILRLPLRDLFVSWYSENPELSWYKLCCRWWHRINFRFQSWHRKHLRLFIIKKHYRWLHENRDVTQLMTHWCYVPFALSYLYNYLCWRKFVFGRRVVLFVFSCTVLSHCCSFDIIKTLPNCGHRFVSSLNKNNREMSNMYICINININIYIYSQQSVVTTYYQLKLAF